MAPHPGQYSPYISPRSTFLQEDATGSFFLDEGWFQESEVGRLSAFVDGIGIGLILPFGKAKVKRLLSCEHREI